MKSIIVRSAVIAASTFLLFSCSSKDADKTDVSEKKPLVKVATVSEENVANVITLTSSIEADKINNITAASPNRIKQILVDEGMMVSKGQKLVVMDDINTDSYQLQLDNARANLKNIEINYNRALELFKIGGGTKQQVDQMELQLINAKNAVASAERTLRNMSENTVLVSPVSGVVTARNYDPGDMTGTLPILTVGTINPVKVVFNVNESDFTKVHKGMPGILNLQAYGDTDFHGTVTMVAPTVDAASRTFGVELTVNNQDNKILPGMFGRVTLNLGEAMRVVVPDKAVEKQRGSGNHLVYVYKDGKVYTRMVELGRRMGSTYEIISGLEPGEQVVISEKSKLADGREVDLNK